MCMLYRSHSFENNERKFWQCKSVKNVIFKYCIIILLLPVEAAGKWNVLHKLNKNSFNITMLGADN